MTRPSPVRYECLDALRGLAALTVVFHHCFRAFENTNDGLLWWLDKTPFRLLVSGRPAVILFFVLSGFVLALSLEGGMKYRDFIIRRLCRIYLPFAFSIGLAALLYAATDHNVLAGYTPWFSRSEPLTWPLLAGHFLMYGDAPNSSLNPVMWSLVYELRISLLFPLLMWVTYRFPVWRVLAVSVLAALSAYVCLRYMGYSPRELHFASSPAAGLALTIHFALYFVIGAALAKHRDDLAMLAANLSTTQRILLVGGGAPLLLLLSKVIPDIPLGLLSALLIVLAINGGAATQRALHSKPALFLGRISYSLYLVHNPLFHFIAQTGFARWVPMYGIWFVWPALALVAGALLYQVVEKPSMALGRWLVARTRPARQDQIPQIV